jgi:hypothetical protein
MIQQWNNTKKLFEIVTLRLEEFISQVRETEGGLMATDKWTVDDVLRHVTFWHNNYADNYQALSKGEPPPLLEGPGYRINIEGVDSLQHLTRAKLIKKLEKAHASLRYSILIKNVPKMKYRVQGQVYTSRKFLDIVEAHLRGHIKQIKKAH